MADYKDKDIEFVVVSIDRDFKTFDNYIKKNPKSGNLWFLDCAKAGDPYLAATTFGIGGVPYFALIDKEGKYIRVNAPRPSGGSALRKIIDTLSL